jgi:hypothetical protein
MSSGCQNVPPKISLEPAPLSTSPELVPSSSLPRILHAVVESSPEPQHYHSQPRSRPLHAAIFPDPSRWCRSPRRPCPQTRDAIPEPATTSSSPSPRCCAPCVVLEPATPMTHAFPGPIAPSSSPSLRHRWTHTVPEPTTSSSSPSPQGYIVYFSLSSWAYKSWFWYAALFLFCCIALMCYISTLLWYTTMPLTCRIALICYVDFDMLHCFDMLHYHIALICYIVTLLWYVTLLLFCCIALMCYIVTLLRYATLPLTCRIALICYIAFDMLHYFDMLHCHIAQWWKWAKWDECGNMDQHYCTIKISASNNIQQIGYLIKLKYESM